MFNKDLKSKINKSLFLKESIINHLVKYPTPTNLSYAWGFGSLAGACIAIQIVTGVFLNMYYVPHPKYAFASIEYIMREVNFGWFIRYCHTTGASFFFIVTYFHIGRSIYYKSYQNRLFLWFSGMIIFVLLMGTAFMGYVLPWGQMSFWGATVITGMFSAIPVIGDQIVIWIWGGMSVSGLTLHRFLTLHYVFGFLLAGTIILHLVLLHEVGSNQPFKVEYYNEKDAFYPNFVNKDVLGLVIFLIAFVFVAYFYPNIFNHPDNYIKANPMVTPLHIVPEWYFLPFYAALRAIDTKLLGLIYMFGLLITLGTLPYMDTSPLKNPHERPIFRILFWIWIAVWIFLGYLGSQALIHPYVSWHKPALVFYYVYFLIFTRGCSWIETKLFYLNNKT